MLTVFAGEPVKQGLNSAPINHYSVLRTIEVMYKLPSSGDAKAETIKGIWK